MIVSKVEIKNKRNKNILCGCIYILNPKYDFSEFVIYLETSLKKVASENKEVYLCGDFNIDLLVDEINNYQLYLICSSGFLPLKLFNLPELWDNQTPSLNDNIFCDNLTQDWAIVAHKLA